MCLNIVCVNAGNYLGRGLEYVCNLKAMVSRHLRLPHNFVVFTDDQQDYPKGIVKRPLPHPGLTGWWNKIALFKPDTFAPQDRIIYFDLDTLIVGNLGEIAAYDGEHARLGPFADLPPPFNGPQSGIMAWRGSFGAEIWRSYELTGMPQNLQGGDQQLLNRLHPRPNILQSLYPGKIGSFKWGGGLADPERSILCFHGLPRVHQVFPDGWADPVLATNGNKKLLGGLWWPESDRECWTAMLSTVDDHVAQALAHTPRRGVCVQAGGNNGIFPLRFAEHFGHVHTFEPDPRNFECLTLNAGRPNIAAYNAALTADGEGGVALLANWHNVGQTKIDPYRGGQIPAKAIDKLGLEACDLIYLDIEGYEKQALEGAMATIRRFRPTIAIEDNGLSERYGVAKGETPAWLCREFGYAVAAQIGRDVILTAN